MRISEKAFIENYCNWASHSNLLAAACFRQGIKKANIEAKKILFIKLFYEYMNCTETLLAVLYVISKNGKLNGFRKALLNVPSEADKYRYLWKDIQKYRNRKYQYLVIYLRLNILHEDYNKEKSAYDGLFNALYTALKNRLGMSRKGKGSLLVQLCNKIKHGFTVYSLPDKPYVLIYLKKRRKIIHELMSYSDNKFEDIYGSISALRNTIQNLIGIIISNGFTN